jgi:hypothetical protein
MILKVRSVLKGEYGWLILGGLRDVSWSDALVEESYGGLLEKGELGDYLVFDRPPDPDDRIPSETGPIVQCRVIMALGDDDRTVRVWFNDVAYLMNEAGKTVETIYGY